MFTDILMLQSLCITTEIFHDKVTKYQGQDTAELLVGVGDKFWDVDGSTSGLERRFRVLCGNLFNLPILNTQNSRTPPAS